jgi:hypothetical protein
MEHEGHRDATILRLQEWLATKSHDEGEAWHGQKRFTLFQYENPGWGIRSSLVDTNLALEEHTYSLIERSEHDWIGWGMTGGLFKGDCGPRNLEELLAVFLDLAERATLE